MKTRLVFLAFSFITVIMIFSCTSKGKIVEPKEDIFDVKIGDHYMSPNAPSEPQPFNDISAVEFVSMIKVGWNLGNTLDATVSGIHVPAIEHETRWGNPITTQENINTIKNAGFNAIRIPVSWTKNSDPDDYIMRKDWIDRVTDVVNYAVNNDMYIIMNTHHDEGFFKFKQAERDEALKAFRIIWEQIAVNFKNYNEKLVFEALNEPRTVNGVNEWNGGTKEERDILNEYYKMFINIVRASGGNNVKRIVMITPYGASPDSTAVNALVIPRDSVPGKIIVSVHSYEPYNFAMNEKAGSAWDKTNTNSITDRIDRVYNLFINKGIPVIIGEFGAIDKKNEETRAEWAYFYVKYAVDKGVKCFWWDDGGNFILFNRKTNKFAFPKIVNALMEASQ